jgi:hypothetical protein
LEGAKGFHFALAKRLGTEHLKECQGAVLGVPAGPGSLIFRQGLATGLAWGGLAGAGWAVSAAMAVYFGWYFLRLATWPVGEPPEAVLAEPVR